MSRVRTALLLILVLPLPAIAAEWTGKVVGIAGSDLSALSAHFDVLPTLAGRQAGPGRISLAYGASPRSGFNWIVGTNYGPV